MRKFFALALAVAMVLSLASVSFAATNVMPDAAFDKPLDYSGDSDTIKIEKNYDADIDPDSTNKMDLGNMIEYGDTAYYPLVDEQGAITEYKRIEKLKVKAEFEMGEDLVESISIVKKPVKAIGNNTASTTTDTKTVELADFAGFLANVTIPAKFDTVIKVDTTTGVTVPAAYTKAQMTNTFGLDADELDAAAAAVVTALATTKTNIEGLTVGAKEADAPIEVWKGGAALTAVEITALTDATGVTLKLSADAQEAQEAVLAGVLAGETITGATLDDDGTKVNADKAFTVTTDYYYFLAVKTKKVDTTADADIIGTFEFNRKENRKETPVIAPIKDEKHDFAINLWYDGNYNAEDGTGETFFTVGDGDEVSLKWDDMYILKFASDEEVTLNFGWENEGEFTVDASGQGKVLVNFNTKANEAIYAANEGVKMVFVNFNGAKFNRVGEFVYELEDMAAAYEIVDDKLVALNSLEIDGDTATFYTRTLGNYVFATAELVNP